jgi:DNA-binding Xre family transcriptional regulator
MQIQITNKIEQKVNEYQEQTGATKTWIAKQIGISPARMYQIFKTNNMMIDVYIRFAILLDCTLEDLVEYNKII